MRCFATIAELVEALREFKRLYNEEWLIERHGFGMPGTARVQPTGKGGGLTSSCWIGAT
jgi:hypothetical protein